MFRAVGRKPEDDSVTEATRRTYFKKELAIRAHLLRCENGSVHWI